VNVDSLVATLPQPLRAPVRRMRRLLRATIPGTREVPTESESIEFRAPMRFASLRLADGELRLEGDKERIDVRQPPAELALRIVRASATARRKRPPPKKVSKLLGTLRSELQRAADPDKAEGMQRYMKSSMPYHGVPATALRAVCKRVFADISLGDATAWRREVLAIWEGARHREEWYAAVELAGHRKAKSYQTLDALPLYEQMIVEGAWWDIVDGVASHRLGTLLRDDPKSMSRTMRAWSTDEDLWKRRASIIAQLTFKEATDLALLYDCISPSLDSREFFLQKAIGWALRQLAWTQPTEVRRYVRAHERELSPLSKREALKNL
jgi:3-methyladenine DNA glycosylase AlkD